MKRNLSFWNVFVPQIAIVDGENDEDDCLGGYYDV